MIELTIEVPDREYHAGDTVRGAVILKTGEDRSCKDLALEFGWETHGVGSRVQKYDDQHTLFQGQLVAGRPYRFEFERRIPNGPLTYHGTILNVDWKLRARAEIGAEFECKAEQKICVASARTQNAHYYAGARTGPAKRERKNNSVPKGMLALLSFFVIVGGFAAAAGLKSGDLFVTGIGLLFVAAAFRYGFVLSRDSLAMRKLGPVALRVTDLVRSKEPIKLHLAFTPRSNAGLNAVTVTVSGEEHCVSGSGTRRSTTSHTFHQEEVRLAMGRALRAGTPETFEHVLSLPGDAPPTFVSGESRLQWKVEVHIDIAGWPDWS
ncbi:MAG: hypothetical protein AAF658_02420, partial [Myxococcota bacterium]